MGGVAVASGAQVVGACLEIARATDSCPGGFSFVWRMEGFLVWDHHVYGPEGIRFYTRLKTITSRWPTSIALGRGVCDADNELA
jgi:hypothetical protein